MATPLALLDVHDELAGRLVKTTGDGILATFDGPGRATSRATSAALRDELGKHGLQVRVGLHTGEIESRGDDVGGIALGPEARVSRAMPEEY
jgi:class 3 adenylate cyclase